MIRIKKILDGLDELYPNAKCALDYYTPFELLVSTILSAQCTDKRVNETTNALYKRANTPAAFLEMGQEELEKAIKSCGLYHSKSKNIIATSQALMEKYGGEVPKDLDSLTELPGVGRKTASVVVSNAFGIPAFAVDTHVFRVSNRLGLADAKTPEKVEEQLRKAVPEERWIKTHHQLISHGRGLCDARKPQCGECPLNTVCLWHNGDKKTAPAAETTPR